MGEVSSRSSSLLQSATIGLLSTRGFLIDTNLPHPAQVAAARKHESLARLLHPSADLVSTFGPADMQTVGAPCLAALAAAALKQSLIAQADALASRRDVPQAGGPGAESSAAQGPGACLPGCDDDGVCGLCLDACEELCVSGCGHRMCATCAKQLCSARGAKPVTCPFCRGTIRAWGPVP